MASARQLPLFATQPTSDRDLTPQTPLKQTYALFEQFLKKEGKSEHTIDAFASDLRLLAEYTGENTPIGRYTTSDLNQFLAWMEHGRGVPCSAKTYARRVTTLKVYFRWLHGIEVLPRNPARDVAQRSVRAPLAAILSPDDIHEAIRFARTMKRGEEPDTRPELLLRLLLDTGIKKNETMELTPESVDRSNPQRPVLLVKSKVRSVFKERRIELDPEWVELLDTYLMQYRPKARIFECTARNLEYILTDIGTGAGVASKISFEMLRWTCAVRDTRNGADAEFVREKLGLSPISWHETSEKIQMLLKQQLLAGV